MNQPSPTQPPEHISPAESLKIKLARALEQKRNREVSHMLKSGNFQQHMARRSMPHVRGR